MAEGTGVEEKVQEKQESQSEPAQTDSKTAVQSVEFSEAVEDEAAGSGGSIEILLDMDVPISVSIGRTEIPVRRLLQLGPGSVLKLDKPIDAAADLYLRDIKFATGSVVVVDGQFAVRLEQILGLGAGGNSGGKTGEA